MDSQLPHLDPPAGASACSPEDQDPGAHLDRISIGDEAAGAGPELPPGVLTRDQFRAGLGAAFQLSGGLLGLATLIAAPELDTFPPAADALYDAALESPWLRWLIDPQSVWLQRAIALGAFAVPVAGGCGRELRERREAAAAARPADGAEASAET